MKSESDIWYTAYNDTAILLSETRRKLNHQLHLERMHVIRLEGQRLTLLSQLKMATNLMRHTYPIVAGGIDTIIATLERSHEAAKPTSEVGPDPQPDAGSAPALLLVQTMPEAVRVAPVYTDRGPTNKAPF